MESKELIGKNIKNKWSDIGRNRYRQYEYVVCKWSEVFYIT